MLLRPIVQQLSRRRVRRRRVSRTTLVDQARRSAALQQRAIMCTVHRALWRKRVRRVPRTRPGRRRTLLEMKVRLDQKTLYIKKHRLAQRPRRVRRMHRIHRPRLVKQHPVLRTRHMLKPKLVRRLLPDRRLNPIQRRKRLARKNTDSSSTPPLSTTDGSQPTLRAAYFWVGSVSR